jgi:hypothetical protein
MGNKQGSRLGWATFLVLCFVAAAGLAVLKGMNQPRTVPNLNPRDELVTFVVTFEPTTRVKMVTMVVVAGPTPIPPYLNNKSPMVIEKMLPPGTPVEIVTDQQEDGPLTCKIRKGLKIIAQSDPRDTKGGLHCKGVT